MTEIIETTHVTGMKEDNTMRGVQTAIDRETIAHIQTEQITEAET